ncbi:MAG: hypothetical protein AVDCRST_MAG71-897, partial [uncultured Lysobacter sp.]
ERAVVDRATRVVAGAWLRRARAGTRCRHEWRAAAVACGRRRCVPGVRPLPGPVPCSRRRRAAGGGRIGGESRCTAHQPGRQARVVATPARDAQGPAPM